MSICKHENSNDFLPQDVAKLVVQLLDIRRDTFLRATQRYVEDYIKWDKGNTDHSTQMYPTFEILNYPNKYSVSGNVDDDLCNKQFSNHSNFSYGIFSAGCACKYMVTYGFELMLNRESAHNLFRLLQCRDVDLNTLEGVIFDFACNLHRYVLNREAKMFEFTRFLVDGAHWHGHRKMKKPSKNEKSGHSACSEGYNYNNYKKFVDEGGMNSQTREIMHSQLDKCATSLRAKSYSDFMSWMTLFFAIRNLTNMNLL